VLYFYPRDNTSGCTLEAQDFSARSEDFKKLNAVILGISPDNCQSHQKFILKYDLGITLLSDPEKKVLEKYGVWQIKKMYGKESFGVVRSTFLISPDGKIADMWTRVKVDGHADKVMLALVEHQKRKK
jgi:peroxiredoxin Q/BCP